MKTKFTVHATGTTAGEDLTLRHLDLKDRRHGYAEIGYHWVIRRDGTVEQGRADHLASIHDMFHNAPISVSVILVGGADDSGFPEDNFTPAQRVALRDLHGLKYSKLEFVNVHPSLTL